MPEMQGIRGQSAPRGFPKAGLSAGWVEVPFTEMELVDAFWQEGQFLRDKNCPFITGIQLCTRQSGGSEGASMRNECFS